MLILGISAFYHESAVAAFVDGELVAAAAEERFSRVKHDAALPVEAFRFCLERAGATVTDVDAVAYYELPEVKLDRQLWAARPGRDGGMPDLDAAAPERAIREGLGWEGPILTFPHHLSHAASAYFLSGFPDAAVLTADGVGEWETTAYGRAEGDHLELFTGVDFPHSLGLLYSTLTAYLGFRVNSGEYKVMGLAPYGEPRFAPQMERLLRSGTTAGPGPGFELDMAYFDFVAGDQMYSPKLVELFGRPARRAHEPLEDFHADVAASLQRALEEVLLEKVAWLAGEVDSENLAMAGGVALNCVANGRLLRQGPFSRLFVQPAAGDAGGAVGAAALAHRRLAGSRPVTGAPGKPLTDVRLGPAWSGDGVARMLAATGLEHDDFRRRPGDLFAAVARRLAEGQVVGWFQGAMEFGPRALGGRSILADPRDPEMRDRVNARVKKREGFRPFAPAVPAERATDHFALGHDAVAPGLEHRPCRFMLETCQVRSPLELPAVTHVNGSARPQVVDPAVNPRFAGLLAAFEKLTGCPVLLNTSFNVAGEPIVATPADALMTFATAGLDALVLEDCVVDHAALPSDLAERVAVWRGDRGEAAARRRPTGDLYTFV